MPSQRWSTVLTGLSSTNGFPLYITDPNKVAPFNTVVQCVMNSSAAAPSFNIEGTLDYTGSSAFISSNATWFSSAGIGASSASSNTLDVVTVPVTALRINCTAGSSTQTITITIVSAG